MPAVSFGSAADTDCVQGSLVLSLCDPDAAVAPACITVGTARQVIALCDMELGFDIGAQLAFGFRMRQFLPVAAGAETHISTVELLHCCAGTRLLHKACFHKGVDGVALYQQIIDPLQLLL